MKYPLEIEIFTNQFWGVARVVIAEAAIPIKIIEKMDKKVDSVLNLSNIYPKNGGPMAQPTFCID